MGTQRQRADAFLSDACGMQGTERDAATDGGRPERCMCVACEAGTHMRELVLVHVDVLLDSRVDLHSLAADAEATMQSPSQYMRGRVDPDGKEGGRD